MVFPHQVACAKKFSVKLPPILFNNYNWKPYINPFSLTWSHSHFVAAVCYALRTSATVRYRWKFSCSSKKREKKKAGKKLCPFSTVTEDVNRSISCVMEGINASRRKYPRGHPVYTLCIVMRWRVCATGCAYVSAKRSEGSRSASGPNRSSS